MLCCAALCSHKLCAQQTQALHLNIDKMFEIAEENSTSILISSMGTEAADEALKAAKSQRYPEVSVSVSGSLLGNGRLWDRDFSNGMSIDIPRWGNNFSIEATQVIYAGGAVNAGVEIAGIQKEIAELDLRMNRQEVFFLLTGQYLDLYKLDNQLVVLKKNLELTEQVIAEMIVRREEGTILKNDITRYELQREQLKLQIAKTTDARNILNHNLVTTLHLSADTEIIPDAALLEQQVETLTEKDWQEAASSNNLNLQQALAGIRLNENLLKTEKAERLPQLALVAADYLDGPITIEVPALNNNFNYWYLGLGIRYNLASLYKSSHKTRQAEMKLRMAKESYELAQESVDNAVNAGYMNFITSFTELRTQENSVRLANENYDVVNNRYKNDMALLTDMLDASNMKLDAELGLVNARINVIYNWYKMKYITHTL